MSYTHTSTPAAKHPSSRRLRSPIAAAAAAALTITALVSLTAAPASADTAAPTNGLVAEYLFDETSGSTVPNSAAGSVGPATVVNGSNSLWTGSSLVFTGGAKTSSTASWVRLPDALLTGKTSATITVETKFDASMKSTYNFLWNIGNDATSQYYFASVRDNARTAITTSSAGGEANARAASALSADRWYSLTSVIGGGRITFYVDGEAVGSTATTLTPASITSQTLNSIGRSPWPDPMYKGEVSTFRVYDRALSASEVTAVSEADAALHASSFQQAAQTIVDGVANVTIDEGTTTLPNYGGRVTWASSDSALAIGADKLTVTAQQPAQGQPAVQTTLTATASVRGTTVSRTVPVTIQATPGVETPYGYVMVHFIEDSAGYAEKIYLDVSRGDNPEYWDPLNGGKPILASQLGTTGVRDPYLTYNPESKTYYIIATDLRVFGGDQGVTGCTTWCYWGSQGSTKLNVWESKDLISWSAPTQFDVALSGGAKVADLGMAWAPEATWVPNYNADGSGAFVLYWSSNMYTDATHSGSSYSRVLWGATKDFSQASYQYGGVFIDAGGNTIDTTIIQNAGKTYRITKDNSAGKGIYMESTPAAEWWKPAATWTQLQTTIGAVWAGGNAGGVEGPAVFQRHGENKWYLYVDVIPSTGYRPMETTNLDAGWSQLVSSSFYMAPSTKHGGIVGLTRGQYDTIRSADATAAVTSDLGSVEVTEDATDAAIRAALPAQADVTLTYSRGTASRPVEWNLTPVDASTPGTYDVTGTVRTTGSNLNQWAGAGGSTAWNAANRTLFSSTAITVSAKVVVTAAPLPVTATAETRCVAGKVVLTVKVTNDGAAPVALGLSTAYGSKSVASVAAGKSTSAAFTTRLGSIPAGSAEVTVTAGGATAHETAVYAATNCG